MDRKKEKTEGKKCIIIQAYRPPNNYLRHGSSPEELESIKEASVRSVRDLLTLSHLLDLYSSLFHAAASAPMIK